MLVVDDESSNLVSLQKIFEREQMRVFVADGAKAALDLVRKHRVQVVLTDLMMPGLGGAELARRLRERWPALPILFMSGYSMEDLRREDTADFEGVLIQKPFTPDALVASVSAALAGIAHGHPVSG